LGSIIALLLLVPFPRIKAFFSVGLVGGALLAFILVHLMQNTWHFWIFQNVDLLVVGGIPFFLSMSWLPLIILYSHLLSQYHNLPLTILLVFVFPMGAVFTQAYLLNNQLLVYQSWNLLFTFLLSLAIHLVIALYLYASGKVKSPLSKV